MLERKLGRKIAHRKSLLRNLAASLILYEKVDTTRPKAKELRPVIEKLIVLAKKQDLNGYRRLLAYLYDKNAAKKAYVELAARYKDRSSGFIRLYHLKNRLGDNSEMVRLEFIDRKIFVAEKKTPADLVKDETREEGPKIDRKAQRAQKKLEKLTTRQEKSGIVTSVRTKAARKTGV